LVAGAADADVQESSPATEVMKRKSDAQQNDGEGQSKKKKSWKPKKKDGGKPKRYMNMKPRSWCLQN